MTPSIPHVRNRATILFIAVAALALAACETTGSTSAPQAAAPPAPPMNRARAATECWMSTEKGRADMSLDKRADFVSKCIDDKLKAAKTAAAKP